MNVVLKTKLMLAFHPSKYIVSNKDYKTKKILIEAIFYLCKKTTATPYFDVTAVFFLCFEGFFLFC